MTMQYTTVTDRLPENKMRLYPTKVINIIGGPGCDKSLFSSAIVLNLILHNKTVESIPDYAKLLVWQKDIEGLKNQYQIAQRQFEMLELLDGQVQFLVTESSLPQLLYYNSHYADNICDVAKTRLKILHWYKQHTNVNILVQRGDKKYLHTGRFQNEEEARSIDKGLRETLSYEGMHFTVIPPDIAAINAFAHSLVEPVSELS
jgi:hypothetical protein